MATEARTLAPEASPEISAVVRCFPTKNLPQKTQPWGRVSHVSQVRTNFVNSFINKDINNDFANKVICQQSEWLWGYHRRRNTPVG